METKRKLVVTYEDKAVRSSHDGRIKKRDDTIYAQLIQDKHGSTLAKIESEAEFLYPALFEREYFTRKGDCTLYIPHTIISFEDHIRDIAELNNAKIDYYSALKEGMAFKEKLYNVRQKLDKK